MTRHRCTTTLFVIAQLAEMGCANGLHLNEIVIFEVGLSDLDDSFQRSFNRSSKNKTECSAFGLRILIFLLLIKNKRMSLR